MVNPVTFETLIADQIDKINNYRFLHNSKPVQDS